MSKIALLFLLTYIAGIILSFNSLIWGVYAYELNYFFNAENRWWGSQIPTLRYSLILVVVILLNFIVNYRKYLVVPLYPGFRLQIIILVLLCIVWFFAVNQNLHGKFLIEFAKLNLIILVFYYVVDSFKKFQGVIFVYLIGAAYIGYEAFLSGRNSGARVEGIGTIDSPDANGAAALLVPAATLIFFYLWRGNNFQRFTVLMLGALIANGLVLINSRGSFLGAFVAVALFGGSIILSKKELNKKKLSAWVCILFCILGGLYLADSSFWNRFESIFIEAEKGKEGGGRVFFWLATFDMLADNPMGIGIFGYQALSPIYIPQEMLASGLGTRAVHSTWFQVLSEIGYIGFLFFILLLRSIFKVWKKAMANCKDRGDEYSYYFILALKCGFIGYLVCISFIDRFRSEMLYWFLLYSAITFRLFIFESEKRRLADG